MKETLHRYKVYVSAPCPEHGEHVVSGFTSSESGFGGLKNDLRKILWHDNKECKLGKMEVGEEIEKTIVTPHLLLLRQKAKTWRVKHGLAH